MSRVTLSIDRLVLKGVEPAEGKVLVEALRTQLAEVLGDRALRTEWARSHRTPVLRLGRMSLEPGFSGGRKFGAGLARAIGKGLKP
ncbi:MAG TPA: hypothetical protein VK763_06225 [Terriglobales bacterium]|nr:hypothetical protein [Terriglobales bacterium]